MYIPKHIKWQICVHCERKNGAQSIEMYTFVFAFVIEYLYDALIVLR